MHTGDDGSLAAIHHARQRANFIAANSGISEPPFPPPETPPTTRVDVRSGSPLDITSAPIPIFPTIYPNEPTGTIVVHNHITITSTAQNSVSLPAISANYANIFDGKTKFRAMYATS
jgi:hypothetical protein